MHKSLSDSLLTGPASTVPGFPSLPLDPAKMVEIVAAQERAGVSYGLGAKITDITASPPHYTSAGKTGAGAVDCSGEFRYLVYHASGGRIVLPDGSVNQHDVIEAAGLKECPPEFCALDDGHVRVAFLSPGFEGVGHVCPFLNGLSTESCGGRGPCRRPWTGKGWQAAPREFLRCYVLA